MKLTTKGVYTLQALLDMIENSQGKAIKLSDVADRQKISLNYLQQLFRVLKINGIVKSVRGPGGGYVLAKPADKISIEDVLRGSGESVDYHQVGAPEDASKQFQAVVQITLDLNQSLQKVLSQTLADLTKE